MFTGLKLWTLDEAANLLRMSKSKLRQEERSGRLRFVRSGRLVRVDDRDLLAYVNALRKKGPQVLTVAQLMSFDNVQKNRGTRPGSPGSS